MSLAMNAFKTLTLSSMWDHYQHCLERIHQVTSHQAKYDFDFLIFHAFDQKRREPVFSFSFRQSRTRTTAFETSVALPLIIVERCVPMISDRSWISLNEFTLRIRVHSVKHI